MNSVNFSAWKVDKLKRKLRELGLPSSGNKSKLVARLTEYFAEERYVSVESMLGQASVNENVSRETTRAVEELASVPLSQSSPVKVSSTISPCIPTTMYGASVVASSHQEAVRRVHWGAATDVWLPTSYGRSVVHPVHSSSSEIGGIRRSYHSADEISRRNWRAPSTNMLPTVCSSAASRAYVPLHDEQARNNMQTKMAVTNQSLNFGAYTHTLPNGIESATSNEFVPLHSDLWQSATSNEVPNCNHTMHHERVHCQYSVRTPVVDENESHWRMYEQADCSNKCGGRAQDENIVKPTSNEGCFTNVHTHAHAMPYVLSGREFHHNSRTCFGDVRDIAAILPTLEHCN